MNDGKMGWGETIWAVLFHPFKLIKAVNAGRVTLWRVLGAFLGSIVASVVTAVVLAMVVRGAVIEAFQVPSGSMFPSLEVGDHLFVTKSTYGLFAKSAPARGEVVVYVYPDPDPNAAGAYYITRVIAVAGDEVSFENGAPIINGWRVPSCRLGMASATLGNDPAATEYEVFVEFLAGKAYVVAFERGRDDGQQGPFQVKPGEFWVVGDNRNNSSDSRNWDGGRGGGVPFKNLTGRARWLWLPKIRYGIDLADAPVLPGAFGHLAPELESCLKAAPDLAHSTPPPASVH